MEDSEQEFLPDFTYKELYGVVASKQSRILQKNKMVYISAYNRVNCWSISSREILNTYGTLKNSISAFNISENVILIGYDNGMIEIAKIHTNSLIKEENKVLKLHTKRITSIEIIVDSFVSTSADGTICLYDMSLDEMRVSYKGNSVCADKVLVKDQFIYVVCGDKTVKVWKIYAEDLYDVLAFDDFIMDMAINGNEALIFFKTCRTCFYRIDTKEKRDFDTFKKLRNVVHRENRLAVQCQKETFVFEVVKTTNFGLKLISKVPTSDSFTRVDFYNDKLIFLTKNNSFQILDEKTENFLHESEILQIEILDNQIFTLSEEKIVKWIVETENEISESEISSADFDFHSPYLSPVSQIKIQKSSCFCILGEKIVVGGKKGLKAYSIESYDMTDDISSGRIDHISSRAGIMAVCNNTSVSFYDESFQIINHLTTHDPILYSRFSSDASLFCVSTADSKIYIYNYPDLSLKFSLYGHSFPVRSFDISQNNNLLISCGADKLIKLWGLEMGECKKTILGNARNVDFVNEDAYLFGDKDIMYYRGFHKLRKFRSFEHSLVSLGRDFFVASCDFGLSFFKMNKFEFAHEESSEQDHPLLKTVADLDSYDKFLQYLENLEGNKEQKEYLKFYQFIEKIDHLELLKYISVLDTVALNILLQTIDLNHTKNIILNSKLLLHLFKFHKDMCQSNQSFVSIKNQVLARLSQLRVLAGRNEANLAVDVNYEDFDFDI